jgi:hypothetical protein
MNQNLTAIAFYKNRIWNRDRTFYKTRIWNRDRTFYKNRIRAAIALLFLTGAGFNQLYVDNPTFEDNP